MEKIKITKISCYELQSIEFPELNCIARTVEEAEEQLDILLYEHKRKLEISKEVERIAYSK